MSGGKPGTSISPSAERYGDFDYQVLDDGTVEISKYTGSGTKVTIPAKINGKTVTSIGKELFSDCSITSITIPHGITNIGDGAFFYCENLSDITIPKNVTSIGEYAFGYSRDRNRLPVKLTGFTLTCFEKLPDINTPKTTESAASCSKSPL